MTSKQLRGLLAEHDVTQRWLARELEVNERTVRYWCAGQPIPKVATMAIAWLLELKVLP